MWVWQVIDLERFEASDGLRIEEHISIGIFLANIHA